MKGTVLRCFNREDGIESAGAIDALEDKDGSLWFHDQTSWIHWDPTTRRTLPGGLPHVGDYRSFERMILDTDGTALVLHATADDHKSDPAGNAGDRIACGVVTAKK